MFLVVLEGLLVRKWFRVGGKGGFGRFCVKRGFKSGLEGLRKKRGELRRLRVLFS